MAALVLAGIGIVLMFSSHAAKGLVRPFLGLVLVLSVIPFIADSCGVPITVPSVTVDDARTIEAIGFLVLAGIGFVLWRRREHDAEARVLAARRDARPRLRALPPPPGAADDFDPGERISSGRDTR